MDNLMLHLHNEINKLFEGEVTVVQIKALRLEFFQLISVQLCRLGPCSPRQSRIYYQIMLIRIYSNPEFT